MGMLDYHNFSWKGDPRWASASRWTVYAPLVVLTLFFLSVIQIVVGAVWVVDLQSNMTVPKILQTLILPGLEFFNTIPSLHCHMLLRRNPPILALWFSSIFAILFLTSSILYIASCASGAPAGALQDTECSTGYRGVQFGPSPALWAIVVALSLVSTVGYATHAAMAAYVRVVMNRTEAENKRSGIPVHSQEVDPALAQEARDRWERLGRYEL